MSNPTLRDWWSQYRKVLTTSNTGFAEIKELNEMTDELIKVGVIHPHRPTPREGAEDLASECDQLIKSSVQKYKPPFNQR